MLLTWTRLYSLPANASCRAGQGEGLPLAATDLYVYGVALATSYQHYHQREANGYINICDILFVYHLFTLPSLTATILALIQRDTRVFTTELTRISHSHKFHIYISKTVKSSV